ncbi:unnamed protein product [Malus baccata var. baccata]
MSPRPSTTGLTCYSSAPGSLLNSAVDSVIGAAANHELSSLRPQHLRGHYFSEDGGVNSPSLTSSEFSFKVNSSNGSHRDTSTTKPLLRSHGLNEIESSDFSSCSSTSLAALNNGGFSVTRGNGSYRSQWGNNGGHGVTRLKSQLSFTSTNNGHHSAMHSYPATSLGMESWDNTNLIVFSAPPKSQFSLPQISLEMATVEKLLHIPEDSVPCKIRFKRGCATHPRSIAERATKMKAKAKAKKGNGIIPLSTLMTEDLGDYIMYHILDLQSDLRCSKTSGFVHQQFSSC